MTLQLQANFHDPEQRHFRDFSPGDDFYASLLDIHSDLTEEQSTMVNARLILILANHIGDLSVLREAMRLARENI